VESSPIFVKTYDLMVWLMPVLTGFPKDQRFRLAARIERALFEFYEIIQKAARTRQPRTLLSEADLELEKLRVYLRLAQDIHCLPFKKYEYASSALVEIGKLLGGWIKKIPAVPAGSPAERGEGQSLGRLLEQ